MTEPLPREARPEHLVRVIANEDTVDFESREPTIQHFARHRAWMEQVQGYGATFVVSSKEPCAIRIWGFYTISMSHVSMRDLPQELKEAAPDYPMPVALIGRLGRDARTPKPWAVGELLLKDALVRILSIAGQIGCAAVLLHAKNDELVSYYQRFGFVSLPSKPRTLLLALAKLRRAVADSTESG